MDFLDQITHIEARVCSLQRGKLAPKVEQKIKKNVLGMGRKMYENFKGMAERGSPFPNYDDQLKIYTDPHAKTMRALALTIADMEVDWTMSLAQARIHERFEDVEIGLIQLNVLSDLKELVVAMESNNEELSATV